MRGRDSARAERGFRAAGLAAFLTALFACSAAAQAVFLPDRWRFRTGDDPACSDPAFDDSGWGTVAVPSPWEEQGFAGYDGNAWYRTAFEVPSDLRGGPARLALGRIDDADEAFLNGTRIGASGSFPPDASSAWERRRFYAVPQGLLKERNVLAVRVHDSGGGGGLIEGPVGLYAEAQYQAEFGPGLGARSSFHKLPISNGLVAAVVDDGRGSVDFVKPHLFQAFDATSAVQAVIGRVAPSGLGLPASVRYRDNTHVVTASFGDVDVSWFAPFTTGDKVLVAAVQGSSRAVSAVRFDAEPRAGRVFTETASRDLPGGRAEKTWFFGFTDARHSDEGVARRAAEAARASGRSLLEDEVSWMRRVISGRRVPPGLTSAERDVFEQSVSVLKMAQVSDLEIFPKARGQILASLPPGVWTIAWVRDGMYSVLALDRLGMFEEARRMLSFVLGADSGGYVRYLHTDGKDYGAGVPYRVSLTRYFGKGLEECDFNENGPNIEFDGFGLFLLALADYVRRSGDEAFFRANLDVLSKEVADPIVSLIRPEGLIRADSGPWERHLPGKRFAWTSIVCAAGLRDFAALGARLGAPGMERYRAAAERLRRGILSNLATRGYLKGNAESKGPAAYDHFDGGTVEAFTLGVVDDPALRRAHLEAYAKVLRTFGPGRGYSRINKGDWYDTTEWVFLDLRFASALKAAGDAQGARALLDWVTGQAARNHNLLPELYDIEPPLYAGAVPMVGFGAGAYALTLWDLYGEPGR